ncbi:MAG: calcium-binding protein [Elainellaceae cyanobacterium]
MALEDLRAIDFDDIVSVTEAENFAENITNGSFRTAEDLGDITDLTRGVSGTIEARAAIGNASDFIDTYKFTVDEPTQFNAILDTLDPQRQEQVVLRLFKDFNGDGVFNLDGPTRFSDLLQGTAFRGPEDTIAFDRLDPGEYLLQVSSQVVNDPIDYQIKFEAPELDTAQLNLDLRNIIAEDDLSSGQSPIRFEAEIAGQVFEQRFEQDFQRTILPVQVDPNERAFDIKLRAFRLNANGTESRLDLDKRRGDLEFDATFDTLGEKLFKIGAGINVNENQGFVQIARGDERGNEVRDGFLSLRVSYDTTADLDNPGNDTPGNDDPGNDAPQIPDPDSVLIIGTDQDDVLDGNERGNRMFGLQGNDTLNGNGGNDILQGAGNPEIATTVGEGEIDRLNGGAGRDTFVLHTNRGMTVLYDEGDRRNPGKQDFAIIEDFNKNQDTIELAGSREEYFISRSNVRKIADGRAIFRDTDNDGRLRKGRDELIAVVEGVNNLSLNDLEFIDIPVTIGTNQAERLQGTGQDGILNGRGKRDIISAKGGNDIVLGGNGNDVLNGGSGDDILDGGKGRDQYRGQGGSDVFVIREGQGRDRILDFKDGVDVIGLAKGLEFEDLSFNQQGNNTLIRVEDEKLAIVKGVAVDQLSAEDFVSVDYTRFEGMRVPVVLGVEPTVV